MNQELATNQEKSLALPQGAWGVEDTSTEDLVLPRVLTVQPTSKMVQKYDAIPGQLRSTLDGSLLAKKGEKLSFVPFYLFDTWIHSQWKNGKWEFTSIEPRNSTKSYEYEEKNAQGQPVLKHERAINAYVMLPQDLEAGGGLPYVLTFKGAKTYQEGRKFVTMCRVLEQLKQPAAARWFSVRTEVVTNEKGTFSVLVVEQGEPTTKEQMAQCYTWYKKVRAMGANVKVDNTELEEESDVSKGEF